MSDEVYYMKNGKYYQDNKEGLLVESGAPKFHQPYSIIVDIQESHYVKQSNRGNAFYDENFYFKVVNNVGLEIFERIGRHNSFPSLIDTWKLDEDKNMIVMTKKPGTVLNAYQLENILSNNYYAIVHNVLSSVEYLHSLNIILTDHASPDNYLYDGNSFYIIDIDTSELLPLDKKVDASYFTDIIDVIYILLYVRDGDIEVYEEGQIVEELSNDYDPNNAKNIDNFLSYKMRDADEHEHKAYMLMREKLSIFL